MQLLNLQVSEFTTETAIVEQPSQDILQVAKNDRDAASQAISDDSKPPQTVENLFNPDLLLHTPATIVSLGGNLVPITDPAQQTLPVGIALFQGEFTMPWGEIAAASVLATIPLIALVLLFQRGIISGLSSGAVKG